MLLRLLYIIAALVILSIVVVAHEFGHYIAGRLCGIGVVEFAVGFGPRIFGFTRKGIQYSLRAFPLGGFCKFVGEDEDDPSPNAMNSQPVWKRFITVAAGPIMNFVFAFVVCVVLLANYAYSGILPELDSIIADTPAAAAGLQAGDVITAVDGEEISFDNGGAMRIREIIQAVDEGEALEFEIKRGDEKLVVPITPEFVTVETADGAQSVATPQIGIQFAATGLTLGQAFSESWGYMRDCSTMMLDALRKLVFKGEGIKDMSGPVGIVSMVSQYVSEGMYMALNFLFVISLNLGIMNLLPLPALDGGRLVFLIVEGIRRKPVPPEKEGLVHAAGFVLLIVLILFVTYNDIVRLISG